MGTRRIAIDGVGGRRLRDGRRYLLDSANEAELSEGGDAVIESNLFDDLAIFQTQHRRSAEVHPATGGSRQRPNQECMVRRRTARGSLVEKTSLRKCIRPLGGDQLSWP